MAVPEGHPAYQVGDYEDVPAEVHGGLTFSGEGLHDEIDTEDKVMWFGFDCAHAGDEIKGMANIGGSGHFWTEEEVVEETEKLAEQLKDLTWNEIIEYKLRYMPEWFKSRVDLSTKPTEGSKE